MCLFDFLVTNCLPILKNPKKGGGCTNKINIIVLKINDLGELYPNGFV